MEPISWVCISAAMVSVSTAISSAELISIRREFSDGVLAENIMRSRPLALKLRRAYELRALLFKPTVATVAATIRLCASVILFVSAATGLVNFAALIAVIATGLFLNYRNLIGCDGSDQMSTIVCIALAPAVGYHLHITQLICAWFIMLQSILSYVVAGIAKLVSPQWRSGQCLVPILLTTAYGNRFAAKLLAKKSSTARASSWFIIFFEIGFLAILVHQQWLTMAILVLGLVFHLINAAVMGLNCFVWSFVSTYPAILLATRAFPQYIGF